MTRYTRGVVSAATVRPALRLREQAAAPAVAPAMNDTPAARLTTLLTRIEEIRATNIKGIYEHVAATAKRSRAGEDIEPVLQAVVAEIANWPSGLRDQILARVTVMARHNLNRVRVDREVDAL